MTTAAELASYASSFPNFRNLLYNGAMQINQRGNVSVTSGNAYGCDRWEVATVGGSAQYDLKQSTDVPSGQGFSNSFHIDVTTADTSMGTGDGYFFRQQLEGYDVQRLMKGSSNAKSLTLKFWVKSPKSGTHIVELYDIDNSRQISKSYSISTADTWQEVTLNFAEDTTGVFDNDNDRSLLIIWWLAAGNNFTSGTLNTSWASATNANRVVGQVNVLDNIANNFYITGVQLEVGTVATPFEHRPYGTELALCQRYCVVWKDNSHIGTGTAYNATSMNITVPVPVPMRATPSPSKTTAPSGNWLHVYVGAVGQFSNSTPEVGESGIGCYRIYTPSSGSNWTVGQGSWCQVIDDATFTLSAEL